VADPDTLARPEPPELTSAASPNLPPSPVPTQQPGTSSSPSSTNDEAGATLLARRGRSKAGGAGKATVRGGGRGVGTKNRKQLA